MRFLYWNNKGISGLWEISAGEEIKKNHFAFGVTLESLIQTNEWLQERGRK